MTPKCLPLRWESTGEQWWYATPIDCAAACGHYDLVRELLHLDTNLLIKLTSLRRIRRLETVWDDESQSNDVAKCRACVARNLMIGSEINGGQNSLIRAGYGGWLLYTAASAGDVSFVRDLLERDPLLVFGEGEYGITDILYAAARSKSSEVFRLLLDFAISMKSFPGNEGEVDGKSGDGDSGFRWEMMNRAVHAAARGGNLELLKVLLFNCTDVLAYRDLQGSTVLHSASARGQVEVVKDLITTYQIIDSTDNRGNTALHVAAYRGYLTVVEALITASPSLASSTNNKGETFLHLAVAGFRAPGFHRIDQQIELMKQLMTGNIMDLQDIVNVTDNEGRTPLHVALLQGIQSCVIELLMNATNICVLTGISALDLLKQRPEAASSEILIKALFSDGHANKSPPPNHLKIQDVGSSPGTSFRIPDAEIYLYSSDEYGSEGSCDSATSDEISGYSVEPSHFDSGSEINSLDGRRLSSISSAARRFKDLLQWPKKRIERSNSLKLVDGANSFELCGKDGIDTLIPLRQKYSRASFLLNSRRAVSFSCEFPSPLTRKKFTASLMQGVVQPTQSTLSPLSRSFVSSPTSVDKQKGMQVKDESLNGGRCKLKDKQGSFRKKLMNQYFCFGAEGLAVEDSVSCRRPKHRYSRTVF